MQPSNTIRHRFLSESDAKRLYLENPRLGRSPRDFCPTCGKDGHYTFMGVTHECDCAEQLQLHKHYLAAGIGITYQRLGWDDWQGDPNIKDSVEMYLEHHARMISRGIGMVLSGKGLGTGKTLGATLLLKSLVGIGYDCYSTTFASMVEMLTAGWRDAEEKRYFQRKVVQSDVLLLDDLGREFKTKTKLAETAFDDVLRRRVQHGRPTIITTNMPISELSEGYGSGVLSLLLESSTVVEVEGEDFRPQSRARTLREVMSGETRPIF